VVWELFQAVLLPCSKSCERDSSGKKATFLADIFGVPNCNTLLVFRSKRYLALARSFNHAKRNGYIRT
jgi:hypothetical protein